MHTKMDARGTKQLHCILPFPSLIFLSPSLSPTYDFYRHAVLRGNLECLKYAHENGCPWHERVCEAAAARGYLDCLKYLLSSFFSPLPLLILIFRYAHENGCQWTEKTSLAAKAYSKFECLKYALDHGCTYEDKDLLS
jgi:hypothetical protein